MFAFHTTKTTLASLAAAGALMFSGAASAAPLLGFDFSSENGQPIQFTGNGNFQFGDEDDDNDDFEITNQTGGNGVLGTLKGDLDGQYTFSDPSGAPSVSVTTTNGELTIDDGTNVFTAPVNLITISEVTGLDFANIEGELILGSATYGGSNDDLIDIASRTLDGPLGVSFQTAAIGGQTDLDNLFTGNVSTSYSGSVGLPVPAPATLGLLGAGLIGLGVVSRRRKAA